MIGLPVFAWLPGRFAREMERKNLFGRRLTLQLTTMYCVWNPLPQNSDGVWVNPGCETIAEELKGRGAYQGP
jgi:hypothetical protein